MKFFETLRHNILRPSTSGDPMNSADAPLGFLPGHFYSPIPSIPAVLYREDRVFNIPSTLAGINLNVEGQTATIEAIAPYSAKAPFDNRRKARFSAPNDYFSAGEATLYFGLLNWLKPTLVIEVGSGYTTTVVLDFLDVSQKADTVVCCIEPYPDVLKSLLWPGDERRLQIMYKELQDVDRGVFEQLRSGDVLFVDSTHVSKIGSDVHTLLFEILPLIASGVYVHVHDIFYPFEYPREWLLQGRAWNEAYILRAFLQYNDAFEIVCFNTYLARFHCELCAPIPLFLETPGSGLWLRKR